MSPIYVTNEHGAESMEEFLSVGVITTSHGVKGEVKVYPTTDDVQRFKKSKELLLCEKNGHRLLEVEGVKFFKQFVILKFKGIDDMDAALGLKNKTLCVSRSNAVKLSKDEYFVADLFDMAVEDDKGNYIGKISDVLHTGANDVYEISTDDGNTHLIPAIRECVRNIDIENAKMTIHVMEGLFE